MEMRLNDTSLLKLIINYELKLNTYTDGKQEKEGEEGFSQHA